MMIEIAGKEYEVKFTINMLCEMSEQGYDVMNGLNHVNMSTIRDLFYYSIKSGNKKVTKAQCGDLIDQYISEGHTFDELIDIVMTALGKSLGNDKKEEDKSEGDDEGLNQ